MHLPRFLTTTLAAAAVAVSGLAASAMPARANDDLIRFIAGAAAIAGVLHVIEKNRSNDRDAKAPQHDSNARAPRHNRHRAVTLPQRCAVELRSRNAGRQVYYGESCLREAGIRTRNLPNRCEVALRAGRESRTAYSASCLQSAGHSAARKGPPAHGRRH